MTAQQLRAIHQARPFRPFTIVMGDGAEHHVGHPEFLSMSPSGRIAVVHRSDEAISILDLLLMTELRIEPSDLPPPNGAPPKV